MLRAHHQLSVSVVYDVDYFDIHCNSQINKLAERTFQLLLILNDINLEHSTSLDGNASEEGHTELVGLKRFLGFMLV